MKRMLIIMVMLLLAGTIVAQEGPTDKGVWTLGGSVSFTSQSGDMWENGAGDAMTTLLFMPTAGYFVAPNIIIGGVANVSKLSQGDNELNHSTFGPMFGYYFSGQNEQVKGSFYPSIKLMVLFHSMGDEDDSDSYTSFGGIVGADYMMTNSVSMNFGLSFLSDSYTPDGASESISGSTMNFGIGLGIFIY